MPVKKHSVEQIIAKLGQIVPAPILQQIPGHRSIVTTQNYIGRLGRAELARIPRAFTETYGRAV